MVERVNYGSNHDELVSGNQGSFSRWRRRPHRPCIWFLIHIFLSPFTLGHFPIQFSPISLPLHLPTRPPQPLALDSLDGKLHKQFSPASPSSHFFFMPALCERHANFLDPYFTPTSPPSRTPPPFPAPLPPLSVHRNNVHVKTIIPARCHTH